MAVAGHDHEADALAPLVALGVDVAQRDAVGIARDAAQVRRHDDAGELEAPEHERLLRRVDLRADDRMGGGDLDGEALRDEPFGGGRRQEAALVVEHERRPRPDAGTPCSSSDVDVDHRNRPGAARRSAGAPIPSRGSPRPARRRARPAPSPRRRCGARRRRPRPRRAASRCSAPSAPGPRSSPARRARPPSCGRRSKSTTRCPRSAAPRAASSPATPPPTTTTAPAASAGDELGELRVADAGVHRAPHRPVGVEAADAALVDADARAARPGRPSLRGQVGVGDDRARHRDQVDAARHGTRRPSRARRCVRPR